MNRIIKIFILCVLLVGCNHHRDDSPFTIIDSQALSLVNGSTYWLDNSRVIFTGKEGVIPKTRKEAINRPSGIYIWDVSNNKVTKHASLAPRFSSSRLCYAEGQVFYVTEYRGPDKNKKFCFGIFGKEKEYVVEGKRGSLDIVDRINCLIGPPTREVEEDQHRIKKLYPRHGYLDFGPYGQQKFNESPPLYYIQKQGVKKHLMPWRGHLTMPDIRYYPFKNAYLIKLDHWDKEKQVGVDPNPNGFPQPLRWLYPDGSIEEIALPWVSWQKRANLMFYATKKGFFIVSHNGPEHHGGYLYSEGKYQKVISGYLHGTSISPDGCRAAFSFSKGSWSSGSKGRDAITTINSIDFCNINEGGQ